MRLTGPDRYLALGWFMVSFILVGSLLPGSRMPKLEWNQLTGLDKIAHFLSYGLCYFFFIQHFNRIAKKDWIAATGFLLLFYGLSLEFIQKWCNQGRHFDLMDLLANTLGLLSAYCLFRFLDT